MKDKEKMILWLIYAVLIVVAIIVGFLLINVNVRIGIQNETSQFIDFSGAIRPFRI